jgi:hypothetical protein
MLKQYPYFPTVRFAVVSIFGGLVLAAHQLPNDAKPITASNKASNPNRISKTRFHQAALQAQSFRRAFTSEEINYFLEVALKSEFGDTNPTIKKWDGDINIKVYGTPTAEDLSTLQSVIDELNIFTTQSGIRVQLVSAGGFQPKSPSHLNNRPSAGDSNLELYFVPESQFAQYEPNYQPVNMGFFWTWWNGNNAINRSKVLISTVGITQKERSHLIREELTQSLGLMGDSYHYQDSIFYQDWTDTEYYSEIDKAVIEMLYRPEIRPGMTRTQVLSIFQTLNAKATQPTTPQCGPNDAQPALDFATAPFCGMPY